MAVPEEPDPIHERIERVLFGPPRSLSDRKLFHRISLVPILAWVGVGADGLSSSAYGPEEAFHALGEHTYLSIPLVLMMALTVFILCSCYSRIIESFPQGGGGYVVASASLGRLAGVVSGSALMIDYVLTITVSIAAAGSALFSLVDVSWHGWKLPLEIAAIVFLVTINIRGVRESVLALLPIFILFGVTHSLLLGFGVFGHLYDVSDTASKITTGFRGGWETLGPVAMLLMVIHAYSLGAGTYTGIEAVSNSLPIMREPRVQTAKRTMVYMGVSLTVVACGLVVCYLFWHITPEHGKTMNAILTERVMGSWPFGGVLVFLTVLSEGALLIVAAQTGFIDGPRVLSNMAADNWVPRSFGSLSERLTARNGILLMGITAMAALVYTHGDVRMLVVMYSINVFVTFTLSLLGMTRRNLRAPGRIRDRLSTLVLFMVGTALAGTILGIMIVQKFSHGGWLTLLATASVVAVCMVVHAHYEHVNVLLRKLHQEITRALPSTETAKPLPIDRMQSTAAILVSDFNGLGIHTMFNVQGAFPGYFKNLLFISVGVVDSGQFKGEDAIEDLKERTEKMLKRYTSLANAYGFPSDMRYALGTDVVDTAEQLCMEIAREFPRINFFAGKVAFRHSNWSERLLHNQTAFAVQRRLHWAGKPMFILPVRLGA